MKLKLLSLTLFFSLLLLNLHAQPAGKYQRNALKHYKAGNYMDASLEAIQALKIKPKMKNSQEVLSNSYELAMEYAETEIGELEKKCETFDGAVTLTQRKKIVSLYSQIFQLDKGGYELSKILTKPKYPLDFERKDVKEQIAEANVKLDSCKVLTANYHYKQGVELAEKGDRISSRSAALEFKKANNLVPGYKDASAKYKESRKAGTMRIAVLPFENRSENYSAGDIGSYLSSKIEASLINKAGGKEFVQIVTRDQLSTLLANADLGGETIENGGDLNRYGQAANIHLIITGEITQCVVQHKDPTATAARQVEDQVVVDYEYYTNDKGKRKRRAIYGPVYATERRHSRESIATMNGSLRFIDAATNTVKSTQAFQSDQSWYHCWLTYSGDERAVNWAGCSEKDAVPPADTKLINGALDKITPIVMPQIMPHVN